MACVIERFLNWIIRYCVQENKNFSKISIVEAIFEGGKCHLILELKLKGSQKTTPKFCKARSEANSLRKLLNFWGIVRPKDVIVIYVRKYHTDPVELKWFYHIIYMKYWNMFLIVKNHQDKIWVKKCSLPILFLSNFDLLKRNLTSFGR